MDIHQERLIRRAASGDDGAFEQLMLAQQKQVYNLCLRMSGNPEDAFDLSQEAFLRAWRALAQYQFEAEFSTWRPLISQLHLHEKARSLQARFFFLSHP